MSRALRAFGVAAVIAVALVGCSPTSVAPKVETAVPDALVETDPDGPWAFVVDDDLHVGVAGSSTCPPMPTRLETDGDSLVVTIETGDRTACTADLVPAVYRLQVDEIPDTVEFVQGDRRSSRDVFDG